VIDRAALALLPLLVGCMTSDYQVIDSGAIAQPTDPACDLDACEPPSPCLAPICLDDGACAYTDAAEGAPCFRDLCSLSATCQAGVCTPAITRTCPEPEGPCQRGICNPATGACAVEPLPEGTPCALDPNQDPCGSTGEGTCAAGFCQPQAAPPQLIYTQDFAKEGDGWLAEHPWQIGPAQPSMCAGVGPEDPQDDHSDAVDGRLAGLLIGACLAANSAPNACLTSPPIPLLSQAAVHLRFWATEPSAPLLTTVEHYDGRAWLPLTPQLQDAEPEQIWRLHELLLPPQRAASVQLRFCVATKEPLLQPLAGWSLDDITLTQGACLSACDALLEQCLAQGITPELCAEQFDACVNNNDPAP
jgi:hypothetical protein